MGSVRIRNGYYPYYLSCSDGRHFAGERCWMCQAGAKRENGEYFQWKVKSDWKWNQIFWICNSVHKSKHFTNLTTHQQGTLNHQFIKKHFFQGGLPWCKEEQLLFLIESAIYSKTALSSFSYLVFKGNIISTTGPQLRHLVNHCCCPMSSSASRNDDKYKNSTFAAWEIKDNDQFILCFPIDVDWKCCHRTVVEIPNPYHLPVSSLKEHRHMFKEGESVLLESWTIRLCDNPSPCSSANLSETWSTCFFWGFTFRQDFVQECVFYRFVREFTRRKH